MRSDLRRDILLGEDNEAPLTSLSVAGHMADLDPHFQSHRCAGAIRCLGRRRCTVANHFDGGPCDVDFGCKVSAGNKYDQADDNECDKKGTRRVRLLERRIDREIALGGIELVSHRRFMSRGYFLASGVTVISTRFPSRSTITFTGVPIFTASSA